MGYGVFHSSKGTSTGGGLGNHIDREAGMEHTYSHADASRRDLNRDYTPEQWKGVALEKAIAGRIAEGYQSTTKTGKVRELRSDAVKFISMVFSGTHQDMMNIFRTKSTLRPGSGKGADWVRACRQFAQKEFGAENIVRFTLHMDEKTPHIHCVVVPLTKDGRLSAKEVMGNKQQLSARQDRFGEAMQPFGLERGVKASGVKHEDAKAYYGRMAAANLAAVSVPEGVAVSIKPPEVKLAPFERNFLGTVQNPDQWKEGQERAVNERIGHISEQMAREAQQQAAAQLEGARAALQAHAQLLKEKERLLQKVKSTGRELEQAQKQVNTLKAAGQVVVQDLAQILLTGKVSEDLRTRYAPHIQRMTEKPQTYAEQHKALLEQGLTARDARRELESKGIKPDKSKGLSM